jgi:hypothetical protein
VAVGGLDGHHGATRYRDTSVGISRSGPLS